MSLGFCRNNYVKIANMKIIIGNWKTYLDSPKEAKSLFEKYKILSKKKNVALMLAPSHIHLLPLRSSYKGKSLSFVAQSLGFSGAHTGCTSARQIKETKVDMALVGHSEERARGLDDEGVAKKVQEAHKSKILPIIIVGEHKRDSEAEHYKFVRKQIQSALKYYPANKPLKFIIAYEPVWAVGAAKPPSARDIEMMMIYIRKTLVKLFGDRKGRSVPLIYGGSVNSLSAASILSLQEVSGVLLGRASVDAKELEAIISKIK